MGMHNITQEYLQTCDLGFLERLDARIHPDFYQSSSIGLIADFFKNNPPRLNILGRSAVVGLRNHKIRLIDDPYVEIEGGIYLLEITDGVSSRVAAVEKEDILAATSAGVSTEGYVKIPDTSLLYEHGKEGRLELISLNMDDTPVQQKDELEERVKNPVPINLPLPQPA